MPTNVILYLNANGEKIPIKIKQERNLDAKIYWSFTEICIAKNLDADNLHNTIQNNFCGSNHYLGDEGFVFNNQELILSDIFLSVPEENFDGKLLLQEWLKVPKITGLPFLLQPQNFFTISSSDCRYLNPTCDHLLCLSKDVSNTYNCLRISIHDRLDLLFQNNSHCGFILYNPIKSIVRFDGNFTDADLDIDLSLLYNHFYTYFKYITLSNWERLENKDGKIKKILTNIVSKTQKIDFSIEPAYALNRQCQLLLEDYYKA